MARDWEEHIYFEHQPLSSRTLARLIARLGADGLVPDMGAEASYSALAAIQAEDERLPLGDKQIEAILRTRQPPVGAAYGLLPFRAGRDGLPAAPVLLSFGRPDVASGLDTVSLVVDGRLFRADEGAALDAAVAWLIALAESVDAVYGWGDWETAVMFEASLTARDVRVGHIPRLLRVNLFGPALLARIDSAGLVDQAGRTVRRPSGALVVEAPGELRRMWPDLAPP